MTIWYRTRWHDSHSTAKCEAVEMVILECTKCGGIGTSKQSPTDPEGTAKVRMLCPECAKGDFSLVSYFDASGKQLLPRLSRCA